MIFPPRPAPGHSKSEEMLPPFQTNFRSLPFGFKFILLSAAEMWGTPPTPLP